MRGEFIQDVPADSVSSGTDKSWQSKNQLTLQPIRSFSRFKTIHISRIRLDMNISDALKYGKDGYMATAIAPLVLHFIPEEAIGS
jgi:hypothetical protein